MVAKGLRQREDGGERWGARFTQGDKCPPRWTVGSTTLKIRTVSLYS